MEQSWEGDGTEQRGRWKLTVIFIMTISSPTFYLCYHPICSQSSSLILSPSPFHSILLISPSLFFLLFVHLSFSFYLSISSSFYLSVHLIFCIFFSAFSVTLSHFSSIGPYLFIILFMKWSTYWSISSLSNDFSGSVPTDKRQSLVDSFNRTTDPRFLFLLSSKAGGVGINLWVS